MKKYNSKFEDQKIKNTVNNYISREISFMGDNCNVLTSMNLKDGLIDFIIRNSEDGAELATKIFNDDCFGIYNNEKEKDYVHMLFHKVKSDYITCDKCINVVTCKKKWGKNEKLKETILHLYGNLYRYENFELSNKDYNFLVDCGCDEIEDYLTNSYISKYTAIEGWQTRLARELYKNGLLSFSGYKRIEDYFEDIEDTKKVDYHESVEHNSYVKSRNSFYEEVAFKSDALSELKELIGLDVVKNQIEELNDLLAFKKLTKDKLCLPEMNMNCSFEGNPGTGKTTVAKLYADLLYESGFIKTNKLVAVSADSLIAGHIGGTAIKTKEVIESALGGVLFIDEAYQLTPSSDRDFSNDCIATLVREMTEHENDLVVIFAGYKEEMQKFIESNPGMTSRITHRMEFEDYSPEQLYQIFKRMIQKSKLELSNEAEKKIKEILKEKSNLKDFGNARFVKTLCQKIYIKHSSNTMKKIRNKEICLDDKEITTVNMDTIVSVAS